MLGAVFRKGTVVAVATLWFAGRQEADLHCFGCCPCPFYQVFEADWTVRDAECLDFSQILSAHQHHQAPAKARQSELSLNLIDVALRQAIVLVALEQGGAGGLDRVARVCRLFARYGAGVHRLQTAAVWRGTASVAHR